MRYWIIKDNAQSGPYELEQLPDLNVLPNTPVWHEGLTQWIPASQVPEIVALFRKPSKGTDSEGTESKDTEKESVPTTEEQTDSTETKEDAPSERISSFVAPTTDDYKKDPQYPQHKKHPQEIKDMPEKPPTYLGWAIASTILCCMPLGIVAIIYSSSINSKYYRGDYEGAKKASERAQWFIILAITLGLIISPLQALSSFL